MADTTGPWDQYRKSPPAAGAGSGPWRNYTGAEPVAPSARSLGAAINDTVIEVANAAAGGVSSAANAIKPGNSASKWIDKNIIKAGEEKQSDVVKAEKQRLSSDLASSEGIGDEIAAVGRYVVNNPVLAAAQAAGSFVGPGAAVKGATTAARALGAGAKAVQGAGRAGGVAAGAAMAGGDAAGTAYDLAKQAGATEDQAVAAGRQASVIPAIVGGAGGAFGAEKLLAGAKGFAGGTAARALKTGASEALQEGIEEGVTQYEGQRAAVAFSWFSQASANAMQVHQITRTGTALIGSIDRSVFSAGLMAPGTGIGYSLVPYAPTGFGGVVYRKTVEGKKKRLWMQFDPYWSYEQSYEYVQDYPGARPMLLVSDDNGLTWARRLLPTPWSFRAGFVVSIDEATLAMPVLSPRVEFGRGVRASIHVSKNGGDSWAATEASVPLPWESWADGHTVVGAQYWFEAQSRFRFEQDLSDAALEFNRGELLPMLALRGPDGKTLPANPARPWMCDYRFEVPDYG